LPLPGICRRFKSLQLANGFERAALAKKLRAKGQVLPAQKPAHELCGRYGCDLPAQFTQGQAMNAGEQAAVAPFGLTRC
jgi:hypothetical protein